ncbi:MAG: basic amino acid ABC transporter substrate-binding protein [Lachnospiraceae bacterium]|nr:basic amino acid ABC transporter substrate-binding protein [Lachnospiraceae bacterium]
MKKLLAMAMVCAMSASLLVGCGTSEKESAEAETEVVEATEAAETTEATEAEATEVETEAAAAEEVATDGDTLVVGTNAEFPPFEYVGDDGEPDGFDIALIKAIGEKIGMNVQIENMEFASLISSIGTKIDAAIAGMTVTDERKEMVDFSDSYYTAVQYVLVPADSKIASAADLTGKTIGVQLGTTGDFIAEEIEGSETSQYNKAVDAVNDLINGRVDLVIIDKNPALVFESKFEGQVIAIDGAKFEFEPEEYAIALPKGNTDLVEKINGALAEMKEDGTFDALVAEYIEEN